MKSLFDYHVVCRPDDNGSFVAYVPAIDGCHSIGHTPEEAQDERHSVFEMISEEYAERGQQLPDDVKITVTHAAKARELMRVAGQLGFVQTRQKGSHAR